VSSVPILCKPVDRCNCALIFWWGEMGKLVHYYHVVIVFGAVSVQEHHCLSVGLVL